MKSVLLMVNVAVFSFSQVHASDITVKVCAHLAVARLHSFPIPTPITQSPIVHTPQELAAISEHEKTLTACAAIQESLKCNGPDRMLRIQEIYRISGSSKGDLEKINRLAGEELLCDLGD